MTGNNPKVELVNINACIIFGENLSFFFKLLMNNNKLRSIKNHNSFANFRKMTGNNPNRDLIKINAYTRLDEFYHFFLNILS